MIFSSSVWKILRSPGCGEKPMTAVYFQADDNSWYFFAGSGHSKEKQ